MNSSGRPHRPRRPAARPDTRLHVAAIDCHAHGICAELLPELIALDEWGYPILPRPQVPPELVQHARQAVAACPTLALRLQRQRHTDKPPT